MSTIQDVYNAIDRAAPFASAMDFDNAGLLAGNPEQSVSRLLVVLDITSDVIPVSYTHLTLPTTSRV